MIDVVVVGAGIAGLTAAARLRSAGLDVVVVEGRDRIGGRIDTTCDPPWRAPAEAGAEFIHGRHPALIQLLRQAKIPIRPVKLRHRVTWKDPSLWR